MYRLVQAWVEALRTGHFAGFERVSNENVAERHAAARKLLAWDDPSDGALHGCALDRIFSVLERMEAEGAARGEEVR